MFFEGLFHAHDGYIYLTTSTVQFKNIVFISVKFLKFELFNYY